MPKKSRIDAPIALHHIIVRGIERRRIFEADANREIVGSHSLLCYWAARELGVIMTSLSSLLNISVQTIGKLVIRGEKLSKAKKYSLTGK